MATRKYGKHNPKLRPGQVYVRKKDPNFIIKLIRSKYSRWECEVLAGQPPSGSQYTSSYNNLEELFKNDWIIKGVGQFEVTNKKVVYSSASILQNFKPDPVAAKLYG